MTTESGYTSEEERMAAEQFNATSESSTETKEVHTEQELDEIRKQAIAERKLFYSETGDFLFALAPNGEKSDLNERQWLQVRTKSFKEFFGDWEHNPAQASKIIDENGEPVVMYHGTTRAFDTFRHDAPKTFDLDNVQGAFYLASDHEFVEQYGRYKYDLVVNMLELLNEKLLNNTAQSWHQLAEKWNEFLQSIGTERVNLEKRSLYPDGTIKGTAMVEFDGKILVATEDLAPLWDRQLPNSFKTEDYEYIDFDGVQLLIPKNVQQIVMALFANVRNPIDSSIDPEDRLSMDNIFHAGMVESGIIPDGNRTMQPRTHTDGVIARNLSTGGFALAVFDGKQLKSATGNQGQFSLASDNIYQ